MGSERLFMPLLFILVAVGVILVFILWYRYLEEDWIW